MSYRKFAAPKTMPDRSLGVLVMLIIAVDAPSTPDILMMMQVVDSTRKTKCQDCQDQLLVSSLVLPSH